MSQVYKYSKLEPQSLHRGGRHEFGIGVTGYQVGGDFSLPFTDRADNQTDRHSRQSARADPRIRRRVAVRLLMYGCMFWLAAILMVLWTLGVATANTLGGFLHILLVLSLTVLLIHFTMGKHPA